MSKFNPPVKKVSKIEVKPNFAQLPLSEIFPDPQNDHIYEINEVQDDALFQSIRDNGILQPILLRPHPTLPGKFMIIAGHRRYRSAERAGLKEVPVMVLSATGQKRDTIKAKVQFIETNALTRSTTIQENLSMIVELEKAYHQLRGEDDSIRGISTRQLIAQSMGMSERQVTDYITIKNGLSNDQWALWNEGKLTLSNALKRIKQEKEQKQQASISTKNNEPREKNETCAFDNEEACLEYLNRWPSWKIYCKVPKLNLIVRIAELSDGSKILSYDFGNLSTIGNAIERHREHKHLWKNDEPISFEPTSTAQLLEHLQRAPQKSENLREE